MLAGAICKDWSLWTEAIFIDWSVHISPLQKAKVPSQGNPEVPCVLLVFWCWLFTALSMAIHSYQQEALCFFLNGNTHDSMCQVCTSPFSSSYLCLNAWKDSRDFQIAVVGSFFWLPSTPSILWLNACYHWPSKHLGAFIRMSDLAEATPRASEPLPHRKMWSDAMLNNWSVSVLLLQWATRSLLGVKKNGVIEGIEQADPWTSTYTKQRILRPSCHYSLKRWRNLWGECTRIVVWAISVEADSSGVGLWTSTAVKMVLKRETITDVQPFRHSGMFHGGLEIGTSFISW